jgi:hypothetical protein
MNLKSQLAPKSNPKRDEDDQKQLTDRLAELRKSSETLGGWCVGSVIAACLRDAQLNRVALTLGVVGTVLGLIGSTPPNKPSLVDPAQLTDYLKKRYATRFWLRASTILALLGGLGTLMISAWQR